MARSDYELLRAWAAGDKTSGGELFERHFDAVYRFFRNKSSDGVDDLVQGTFLGCVEGIERFRGDGSFRTYLFQTARYQLYAHYRRRKQQTAIDFSHESVAGLGTSPTGVMARKEEEHLLLSALRSLPLDHQIALELSYWEDLTEAEIGEVLELPRGTVASRLRRARERLKELMVDQEVHPGTLRDTIDNLDVWARQLRGRVGPG